jgi:hypothetical protein
MSFEQMLRYAPVHVYLRDSVFHCNWSPKSADEAFVHGRGRADTPFLAVALAYKDAAAQGWVKP